MLFDRPARYGAYAPENFDLGYQGTVTARKALQMSLNLPAIELLADVGPATFLARLHGAGAEIALPKETPIGLAIGLGGLGISLTDLARLYAGIARGGEAPALIERLDGKPPLIGPRRVTDPVAAWYVADILRGAPPPANALSGRIAFKTGTSYGFRDALAVGFDRATTIAVWVGRPDNGPTPGLIGRQAAAPILFDAFERLGRDVEIIRPPKGVLTASVTADLPPPLAPSAQGRAEDHGGDPDGGAEDRLPARRRPHRPRPRRRRARSHPRAEGARRRAALRLVRQRPAGRRSRPPPAIGLEAGRGGVRAGVGDRRQRRVGRGVSQAGVRALSLPQLCWGRWRHRASKDARLSTGYGPDGVWAAASTSAGLHCRHREPSRSAPLLSTPHPAGFAGHPRVFARGRLFPLRGEGARRRNRIRRLASDFKTLGAKICNSRRMREGELKTRR